jgi:hypothetical protein
MKKVGQVLVQREFHVFLFCLCSILFSWPIVTFPDVERIKAMFIYLFVCWGILVAVQFLVSRRLDHGAQGGKAPPRE